MHDRSVELQNWFQSLPRDGHHLFAVLDAARESLIATKLQRSKADFVSLYRGEPEETLHSVAPYLVKLDPESEFFRWLLTTGWGNSWAIFLISEADIDAVRRHLRHFLIVLDPGGAELYFRFYDPRVLRVYLPTCTPFEQRRFFGPVTSYLMETEDGQGVVSFSREGARTIRPSDLRNHPASELMSRVHPVENAPNRYIGRLRMREEQIQAFSDYMNQSFAKRAGLHLRNEYPEPTKTMSTDELNRFIDVGADRAARYGLVNENEIVSFMELMIVYGREFDETQDWAHEILQNPDLTAAEKTEALREHRDNEAADAAIMTDE